MKPNRRKVVVFSNQKGGVGKTTLSRELGIYLASMGKKILLIDTDPQANLSKSLTDETAGGLYEGLTEEMIELRELPQGLILLPGNIRLATLERSLIGDIDAYTRMKELLERDEFTSFEYILIDSPPSLGVLTINALAAATNLVIPMNPSLYSMQGTNDLMATVTKVRRSLNRGLSLLGVIINAFDSKPIITGQIRKEIEETFGDLVFKTALSRSIKIEEAIADRTGVIENTRGKVKDDIHGIGEEFLLRLEGGIK